MRASGAQGPWPQGAQLELLRAVLFEGDEAAAAWSRWRRLVSLDQADLGSGRLLPLAYRRLLAAGIDDPERERIKGTYRLTWTRNHLLLREVAPVMRSLRAAGIPTMVLKGAALTALHYRDPGVRSMADIDLLVPPERLAEAAPILEREGWQAPLARPERLAGATHNVQFQKQSGWKLELHWYSLFLVGSDDAFWAAAVPLDLAGARTSGLSPADQLLHVCAHGLSSEAAFRTQWVVDAITVIRDAGATLDWDRLVDNATSHRLSAYAAEALAYLRSALRAPVPAEVINSLVGMSRPRFERACFRAMMSPPGPARSVRIAWARYRRFELMASNGGARPSFILVLRTTGGYRSNPNLLRAAMRSILAAARARIAKLTMAPRRGGG